MATNLTLGTLFTADIRQFLQGIDQIKNAVNGLNQSFKQAGAGASAMGAGLSSAINKTTTAVQKQNQAVKAAQQNLTGLAGMWQRVQQAMKTSLAYGTAGAAIYTVIDGLKQGVTAIADYDQALKNLQAITQATDAEMVGMADTIKEVSSKYIFSTKEISDGMVLMGQAGFSATQTMQAMEAAAKLAMGTLEDMSLTVDLLTTTIVAFNMKTVESERVADIMANAMNRSKLTLDKLRVSFNYVGNAAYEAGITLEETAAAMSVMSNAGMRASTIGTALRQMIANLIAPNRRVREEFQGLGIDLSQLDPKIAGFSTVIQNLSKVLVDQRTGLVDMTKAYNLFGLRAAQAAAILARSANEDYPRMLAMMYEVGSATTMADKQMEGLIARFKNLAANAQLIAVAIGEGGVIKIMRMLVDALLLATKAIKAFVESGVGKITSSFIAWSAAAAGTIVILKALSNLILSSLIPALVGYAKGLRDVLWAMAAIQGLTIVDKVKMLLSALVGGGPIFLAYALGIGAIIAAYQYWKGAEERQIETLTRSSNAYKTAADTLTAYEEILQKLAERQAKGQNIQVEYEASIKRLLRAYPQLKGVIDENVSALDDNIKKINEYKQASLDKYIENQIKLLEVYNEQLKPTALSEFAGNTKTMFAQMEQDLFIVGEATEQLEQEFRQLNDTGSDTAKSSGEIVDSFGNVTKAEGTLSEQTEKTSKTMKELDQTFVNIAKAMQDKGDSFDTIIEKIRALGATEGSIRTVTAALRKWSDDFSKEAADIEASMANLPHVFTKFFDTLDAGAKVSFAKATKSMESEVAQYQKTAQAILKTEEDRYAAEAFIRTKHLIKFADDVLKEKVTGEQLLKFKKELLEEEKKQIRERLDLQLKAAKDIYEAEIRVAGENSQKRAAAEEKYQKAIVTARQKGVQAIVAIEQAGNNEVVEAYKKTADEVVKVGQKMADDYLNELERMVDASKKKLEQLQKARLNAEEDINEKIRGIKQKGMSDTDKFSDDERRVNELLGKARDASYTKSYDEAKKYYDKASDVASSLAREVKDAQGEIIRSETTSTSTAIRYLEQIKAESMALYDQQIAEEKKKGDEAKTLMFELTDLLKNYGGEWDKLNQTKLKNFIDSLDQIIGRTDRLTEKTSNLKKDWEVMTKKLNEAPKPKEPTLGSQAGLTAVQKKEGGGTITVDGKTYEVGDKEENTIGYGGKTYNVGEESGGSISVGGKTFDVNELADYEKKVTAISEKIQASVAESQESIVQGAEQTAEQAIGTVQQVGADVSTAISDAVGQATSGVATATASAEMARTSINAMSEDVSNISAAALEVKNSFVELGFTLETSVKTQLNDIKAIILEIMQNKITEFFTQAALQGLELVKSTIQEIKTMWDDLKSKTITLTVITNSEGGGASSGGNSGNWGSSGGDNNNGGSDGGWSQPVSSNESSYNESKEDFGGGYSQYLRYGGAVVRGIKDAFQPIKHFAGGGKLPGYGGGDKQIIAAESGEFVVNKESTSKFKPLIEAINNDSIADFGKRFGGIIKKLPAFKSGGKVPDFTIPDFSMGGRQAQPIEVHFHSMYMSGDRASARKFACEVQQQLDDLDKRRGRR